MFSLSNAFQNGMSCSGSTNGHREDAFLVHALIRGQAEAIRLQNEVLWTNCIYKKFLDFDFMGVYVMKIWPFLNFFHPHRGPNGVTCKFEQRPKIINLLSHFCSAHQMLSEIVWHDPVAQTNHGADRLQVKGLCAQSELMWDKSEKWYILFLDVPLCSFFNQLAS